MAMNVSLIRNWVDKHSPQGVEKLAVKAGISASLVNQMLGGNKVPARPYVRRSLAQALGVKESTLFPVQKEVA